MEKIPPETRALYEFLRADFDAALAKSSAERDAALAKSSAERNAEMVTALAKLDSKLDQLHGRIDDVKLAIGVDLDELRGEIGADRGAASSPTAPPSPRAPPIATRAAPTSSGSSGSDGFRSDAEQRNSGLKYVPPPARGTTADPLASRQIVPASDGFRPYQPDVASFGPRIELPRFDGSNPRLWQSRCEDYFRFWNTPSV